MRRTPARSVRALVLGLAIATGSSIAEGQGRTVFETYAEDEGLTVLAPEVLLQDRVGFIWVGTPEGLFRFDGLRFARFTTEDGLPSSRVTALHETGDGRLYVGTRAGLARRDGDAFVPIGKAAGLPEASISPGGIASDRGGQLFVGTTRGLYLSLSAERFHVEGPERPVSALSLDRGEALSFAREGRLYLRDKGVVREAGSVDGLPGLERIDATLTDAAGRLWVRTPGLLFVRPPGGGFERVDEPLPSAGTGSLALDLDGEVLVPTTRGLARREPGLFTRVTHSDGLPSDIVLSALVDREGSLWTGLQGFGLARRAGRGEVTVLTRADGLPGDAVTAIARQRSGNGPLFVGTRDGLARFVTGEPPVVLRAADGLAGDTVLALAAAADGTVYAGSWPGGVTRIAAGPHPVLSAVPFDGLTPAETQVVSLLVRRSGEVWAGTRTGAYRFVGGRFEAVPVPGADDADTVYSLTEDSTETVWGASRGGLLRLTGMPHRFLKRNGLKADSLALVAATPDGGLVVSYREGGVDMLGVDGDRLLISPYGDPPIAADRRVASLGWGGEAFWIGGRGVERRTAEGSRRFGRADGLPSESLQADACLAERDGAWFGTSRGLVRIAPSGPAPLQRPPGIGLSGAFTGGRRLRVDRRAVLFTHERDLRVALAPLTYSEARDLRFRYQLIGLMASPEETSSPELQFPVLPPGDLRLEVSAISSRGGASASPAVLEVRVTPAWYQRAEVKVLGLLLLGGLGWALFRVRTMALATERDELKTQVGNLEAELGARARELSEATLVDPVTRLRNRRFLQATLEAEAERSRRAHSMLATPLERRTGDLVFYRITLDGSRELAERRGHAAAEQLLLEGVRRVKTVVRGSDFLVRFADDELLVITRASGRELATIFAERLLATIAAAPFELPGEAFRGTASVGWAPYPWFVAATEIVSADEVLRIAGLALQRASREGGNRSVGVLPDGDGSKSQAIPVDLAGTGAEVRLVFSLGPG